MSRNKKNRETFHLEICKASVQWEGNYELSVIGYIFYTMNYIIVYFF